MIKLYGNLASRTLRCAWALEEAGLDYQRIDIDFSKGEHLAESYRSVNPLGKVPALDHDGFLLTESIAICTYIADRAPEKALAPSPRTPDRARYDQWMLFVASELEQPLWSIGKHAFALPAEHRIRAMRKVAQFEWLRPTAVLAQHLQDREFLVGNQFTMADLCTAQTLFWARRFKVPTEDPVLDAYLERHTQRPAFQRIQQQMPPPG